MKKIITHDGQFHADEIFTIALIFMIKGTDWKIERRRDITEEELDDPDVWIIDQGGRYQPTKHNFDHHQDKYLSATNVLMLEQFQLEGEINDDLFLLLRKAFQGISEYDVKGPVSFNGFQVSEFFKAFNNVEGGFEFSILTAHKWLEGIRELANKKREATKIFADGRSIKGLIRVCNQYPTFWQSMGKEKILIAPDAGVWKLHSSDTAMYPIKATGKEVFIHANKFIASYRTEEDAVEAAELTVG